MNKFLESPNPRHRSWQDRLNVVRGQIPGKLLQIDQPIRLTSCKGIHSEPSRSMVKATAAVDVLG
jgi:hypothetical protein